MPVLLLFLLDDAEEMAVKRFHQMEQPTLVTAVAPTSANTDSAGRRYVR